MFVDGEPLLESGTRTREGPGVRKYTHVCATLGKPANPSSAIHSSQEAGTAQASTRG